MRLKVNGKLCFVLPKEFIKWQLLVFPSVSAAKYHLEYIVVSYEPGANNFSESTSLSECLLLLRR